MSDKVDVVVSEGLKAKYGNLKTVEEIKKAIAGDPKAHLEVKPQADGTTKAIVKETFNE